MKKKEMIIRTLCDYPNLTTYQIAKRVGCTPTYVAFVEKHWLAEPVTNKERVAVGDHYEAARERIEAANNTQTEMFPEVEQPCVPSTDTIDAILTERGKRYGNFEDHARITQAIKHEIRQGESYTSMEDDMVEAIDMIAHKIGRIVNGDPRYADSWADIAGYAKLVADRLESETR